jgi:hypothetical protein
MSSFFGCVGNRKQHRGVGAEVAAYKRRVRLEFAIVTLVIVVCLLGVACYQWVGPFIGANSNVDRSDDGNSGNSPRAVLVDALYDASPNQLFTASLNRTLRDAGFEFCVFRGQEVTVDFLKRLEGGFSLVILRMHSALSKDGELFLFTAESYSSDKYVEEQSFRLVKKAYATESSQPVFAVNWGFVKRLMAGKFNGSLVVTMGCESTCDSLMIHEVIVGQGAVGYVGWNGSVLLSHSDEATSCLVEDLYESKLPLRGAIDKVNEKMGPDATEGATLEYFVP